MCFSLSLILTLESGISNANASVMPMLSANCSQDQADRRLPSLLVPLVYALEGIATFHFVSGTYEIPEPKAMPEFHGNPPFYTFFCDFSVRQAEESIDFERIGELGENPEERMRNLFPAEKNVTSERGYLEDIDRLNEVIEREGPFQAIFGFSLGSLVAGNLLLDNLKRSKAKGLECDFKLAIFAGGLPPCDFEHGGLLLADTNGEVFPMPTCHVIGSDDPMIDFWLALYNLCSQDKAVIFDHGQGHQLVWDATTLTRLAEVLTGMIKEVEAGGESLSS